MFTWEEAGLLRQMLLTVKWAIISIILAGAVWFAVSLLSP